MKNRNMKTPTSSSNKCNEMDIDEPIMMAWKNTTTLQQCKATFIPINGKIF
jgi:hypothetical protein